MPRRAAAEQARWSCFINKTGLSENQRRRRPKVLVSKESALVTGVHATRSACVSHLNNRVSLLLVLRFLGSRRAAGLKRAFVSKRRSDRNSGLLNFGLFVGGRGGRAHCLSSRLLLLLGERRPVSASVTGLLFALWSHHVGMFLSLVDTECRRQTHQTVCRRNGPIRNTLKRLFYRGMRACNLLKVASHFF